MFPPYITPTVASRGSQVTVEHNAVDTTAKQRYFNSMVLEIDAIGLLCPLPVLRLRKRMASLPLGTHVRLLADDPAAIVDVPHFCAEAGHRFVSMTDENGKISFLVEKR
ncbi:sulfurtransferase TusA family protein [Pseudopelagicola sp. nBUS_19]|uniref:sulfurtransferase TusA family protein n=1 Tax=Pseudopelagicola sp. nBUS_19 TaxID=3395316 RepID=UPI003EB70996